MAALGPDRFSFPKADLDICSRDPDLLVPEGSKVHFDSALVLIVTSHVFELGEIEVAAEFPVYSCQNVQVECSRHAQSVIVGGKEAGCRLLEIGSQQEGVTRSKDSTEVLQNPGTAGLSKFPIVPPRNRRRRRLSFGVRAIATSRPSKNENCRGSTLT